MVTMQQLLIRRAISEDLPEVVRLIRLAFAPQRSDLQVQQDWFGQGLDLPDRQRWVAVDFTRDAVIGTYTTIDFQVSVLGTAMPAIGLAAVAVAPEARGQRVAQSMLTQAIQQAQQNHIPMLMLYPFQHGFYRRLGWAWIGQMYQYAIAPAHLPRYTVPGQVLPLTATDRPAIEHTYQQAVQQHHGWLWRSAWQWDAYFKADVTADSGQTIFGYWQEAALQGYLVLQFQVRPLLYGNAPIVVVREWVALTSEAYRGLLTFLRGLRDQFSVLLWNTDCQDPFPHLLQQQDRVLLPHQDRNLMGFNHRLGELTSGFMWRLVDLVQAFHRRSIQPVDPFCLRFHVRDEILGDRTLEVNFHDRTMTAHLLSQGEFAPSAIDQTSVQAEATLSIEHLTALFAGVRRVRDLLWIGDLDWKGDPSYQETLDRAWQAPIPSCWDFF